LCPFRQLTSLDCPGCGTLRSTHEALHGNFLAAIDYNLFFVVVSLLLAAAWVTVFAGLVGWRWPLPRIPARSSRLIPVIPVLIVVFWVGRNLPVPVLEWLHS
jgi:hypothetical protein